MTDFNCAANSQNIAKCQDDEGTCSYSLSTIDNSGNRQVYISGDVPCFNNQEFTVDGRTFKCPSEMDVYGNRTVCTFTPPSPRIYTRGDLFIYCGVTVGVCILIFAIVKFIYSFNKKNK